MPFRPRFARGTELLDEATLRSLVQLGLVDAVLESYLPRLNDLVAALRQCVEAGSPERASATLHLLLGMSGEAGARRLYEYVHAIYVPLREHGTWPADPGWLPQLTSLALQTAHALRRYCEFARLPLARSTGLAALHAF